MSKAYVLGAQVSSASDTCVSLVQLFLLFCDYKEDKERYDGQKRVARFIEICLVWLIV